MQVPVEIAFRHCEPSGEIRSEVAKQVRRLEKFSPRVTSCRVVVTGPATRHRRGGLFEVELRIAMPERNDIVVDTLHGDAPQHEHALVAIRDAFDAAVRQIEDLAREMRDQVKEHGETDRGRVTKFLAGEDYGFIESRALFVLSASIAPPSHQSTSQTSGALSVGRQGRVNRAGDPDSTRSDRGA